MNNLAGKKYGKLTVLSSTMKVKEKYYWNCVCECGNERLVRSDKLTKTLSCGCDSIIKRGRPAKSN